MADVTPAAAPAAAKGGAALTPEDRQKAQTQLEAYKKSEFEPGDRREVIRQVCQSPKPVQEVFLATVEEDTRKALNTYRQEFKKTAEKLAQGRESKATREEVKKLRAEVVALSKLGDALTKDKIVEVGDPAVKRLRELFTFTREMVLNGGVGLGTTRERLVALLGCRQDLRKSLGITDNKGFPPEKLLEEERAVAEKAPPYDREAVKVMEANKKLADKVPAEEARGVEVTNELRALLGLTALVLDPKLCEAGRGHSKDMVDKGFFAHESPVPGKKTPWDRAKLAGTSASAENIFAGSSDPASAVGAWFHSPGHHVNMLNPGHRRMGMGRHNGHWTQLFGG